MQLTQDQKFALVEEIWYASECHNSCPHLNCWEETQPYGNTVAYETLCECEILESFDRKPDSCPKLSDKIFDLEWEQEQNE